MCQLRLPCRRQETMLFFKVWKKEKCGICLGNVSLIHKLYKEKLHSKYDLNHIKFFLLAGQRFSKDKFANLWEMFPSTVVLHGYSSSESIKIATVLLTKDKLRDENELQRMELSAGTEIKVIDENGLVFPRGTAGEICIRNSSVFLEYLGDQEATKQAKSATGWLHTGDVGIMYDDGKFEVIGRKKDIIKRATIKIFPAEIEKVVAQHPSVSDVVVVGIPDQRFHEEICACVVFHDGSKDEKTKLEELENWCKEQWPPGPDGLSLSPKHFVAMKTIPYTKTAKTFMRQIKSFALKEMGIE